MPSSHPWTSPTVALGRLPGASLGPAGQYAQQANGLVNLVDITQNTEWSKTLHGQRDQLDTLIIFNVVMGAAGAADDNEILSSLPGGSASGIAAPADVVDAGLPENFGRGRGKFKAGDQDYLVIDVQCASVLTADTDAKNIMIVNRAFVVGPDNIHGDVSIQIANLGGAVTGAARLVLQFIRDEDR